MGENKPANIKYAILCVCAINAGAYPIAVGCTPSSVSMHLLSWSLDCATQPFQLPLFLLAVIDIPTRNRQQHTVRISILVCVWRWVVLRGSAGFDRGRRAEKVGESSFDIRFHMLDDHWGKRMEPRRNSTGYEPKPSSRACPLTSPWETSSARGH